MRNIIINKLINLLNNTYHYDNDTFDKVKYGLELLYISITKFIVIIFVALLFNLLKETLITILLFNGLRTFGYGMHAKTSLECYLYSIIIFVLLPLIFINIKFTIIEKIFITILSLFSFILYAPADTHKRPLINAKHRNTLKIKTLLISLIYVLILFISNNTLLINLIILSMVLESLLINPWIYKICNMPYNNYKTYSSK